MPLDISGEAEWSYIVYQIDMADEHPPATISVECQIIEDCLGVFPSCDALGVFFV
tara:strand:- start:315 stop:479 length:165 start_codon:yes stop_codon:yes gene_type:complete